MKTPRLTFTLVLSFFAASSAFALPTKPTALSSLPAAGAVEFTAIGKPSAIRIKGKGTGPEGKLSLADGKASGTFRFDLASLDTGIELRNRHMKEKYLKTGEHPQATLTVKDLALPEKVTAGPLTATLELNGVTKPVSGTFTSVKTGTTTKVDAAFTVLLTDFGIDVPKYAGITVADTVQVAVNTSLSETADVKPTEEKITEVKAPAVPSAGAEKKK